MEGQTMLGVVLREGSVAVCTQMHERRKRYKYGKKKRRKHKENLRGGHRTADGWTLRNI